MKRNRGRCPFQSNVPFALASFSRVFFFKQANSLLHRHLVTLLTAETRFLTVGDAHDRELRFGQCERNEKSANSREDR